MGSLFQIQSNFTVGEISELLHARVDFEGYYKGAKRIRNALVIPQGGIRVRFGTDYIDSIPISSHTEFKGVVFDYDDQERYIVIFTPLLITIYHNNAVVAIVVTTYTADEIPALSIAQSNNLIFICHQNHSPAILKRTAAHAGWSLNASPTFKTRPVYDFLQNYDTYTFTIDVAGSPITDTQNKLGQVVTLISSVAIFTADFVGGAFFAESGTIRLTAFVDSTHMTGRIIQTFDADSGLFASHAHIRGEDAFLAEPAFGASRGWPQKVALFQNRIIFAKTNALPEGLFLSSTNGFNDSFFDFNDTDPTLDTSAISIFLYNKKACIIEHILAYKSLIIFTTSGVFSTEVIQPDPITPTNSDFSLHVQDTTSSVEPFVIDNQVIFFDRGGKIVKNMIFSTEQGSYVANNISVVSSHLIDNPISASTLETPDIFDGVYLFSINGGELLEGSLAVYQTLQSQQVAAWTLSTTDGKFRHVFSDEQNVYFLIERIVDGNTVFYLEQLNFERRLDSAVAQSFVSPDVVVTGLNHLEDKSVRAIGDGFVFDALTVVGGEITLPQAVTDVEVGLNYVPELVPMPTNIQTQTGNNLYLPKRIKALFVDYYQSLGIYVDDVLIPFLEPNVDQYSVPSTLKTDFTEMTTFKGWDPRAEITITQIDPLPFLIRGIGMMVDV